MKRSLKVKILSMIMVFAIITSFVLMSASVHATTGYLKIHMISTGDARADCFLIEFPDNTKMVVDIAEGYRDTLINKLNELGFGGGIKYLVGTHNHADHIGAMDNFLNTGFNINNTQIYYPRGAVHTGDADYNNLVAACNDRGLTIKKLVAGDYIINTTYNGLPFYVRVISPELKYVDGQGTDDYTNPNAASLALKIRYGSRSILMMADCLSNPETNILNSPYASEIADCQVLKVGHHGRAVNGVTSCSEAFLDAAGVTKALITDGDMAIDATIKDRLQARNINYWSSGTGDGYCWLRTNGTNGWETSEAPTWP